MKFFEVSKRILLFLAVNMLVMLTLSVVVSIVLHFVHLPPRYRGMNYQTLMIFCFVWGMGGAFISLAISRFMAKMFMGVRVVDPRTSDPDLRRLVDTVHALAQRARLPAMPEVGIYDSPEINAFARIAISLVGVVSLMVSVPVDGVFTTTRPVVAEKTVSSVPCSSW